MRRRQSTIQSLWLELRCNRRLQYHECLPNSPAARLTILPFKIPHLRTQLTTQTSPQRCTSRARLSPVDSRVAPHIPCVKSARPCNRGQTQRPAECQPGKARPRTFKAKLQQPSLQDTRIRHKQLPQQPVSHRHWRSIAVRFLKRQ